MNVEKILDKALITAKVEESEDAFGKSLVENGQVNHFKSEVELKDSKDDPEGFDVHITRTIVPVMSVDHINISFNIQPSSGSTEE